MQHQRLPVDATAVSLMLVLCMIWGFNQVTIKFAAEGVSLVMQGALRSALAAALLMVYARVRGIPLFSRDGTLRDGLVAGLLFAAEFGFIYAGLKFTTASRMIVFIYLAPCFTAIGLAWLIPNDRLRPVQWAGVGLAFLGIFTAFGEGFFAAGRSGTVTAPGDLFGTALGDACGIVGALLWGATTVAIRAGRLSNIAPSKTLFYQLAVSAVTLPLISMLLGEPGVTLLTPKVLLSLGFQGVVVAFLSYLAWFWLLTRYLASRLAVFSFMTPLFGVGFGVLFLSDPVSPAFVGAAVLVGAGIALVNLRA